MVTRQKNEAKRQKEDPEKWINPSKNIRNIKPVCDMAEQRFLTLLYLLNEYKTRFNLIPDDFLVRLTLYSFDLKNQIIVNAIAKRKIMLVDETFHLGERTYLVIDTELAGIIARPRAESRYKNTISAQALRVLLEKNEKVHPKIFDMETHDSNDEFFNTPRQLEKIQEVYQLIIDRGYFQAMLDLLSNLGVTFNEASFTENVKFKKP